MGLLLTALPTHFDKRRIVERIPFTMAAERVVAAASNNIAFAANSFLYAGDLVVELVECGVDVAELDTNAALQATAAAVVDDLRAVRIRAKGLGKTRDLFQDDQMLSTLVDGSRALNGKGTWYFTQPYYLINGQGWAVECDNAVTAAQAAGGVQVALSFKGSQLILE